MKSIIILTITILTLSLVSYSEPDTNFQHSNASDQDEFELVYAPIKSGVQGDLGLACPIDRKKQTEPPAEDIEYRALISDEGICSAFEGNEFDLDNAFYFSEQNNNESITDYLKKLTIKLLRSYNYKVDDKVFITYTLRGAENKCYTRVEEAYGLYVKLTLRTDLSPDQVNGEECSFLINGPLHSMRQLKTE